MDGISVLITGGLGFIGSNLAHRLVNLGADVKIYDGLLTGYGANWANIEDIRYEVDFVIGDVRDYEKLENHVNEVDVVFHCAAKVSRVVSMSNPKLDIEINCAGAINVLEALKRSTNKEVKVVYTRSRASTDFARELPVDENTPADPTDIYEANKLTTEMYFEIYHRAYGLKSVILSSIIVTVQELK